MLFFLMANDDRTEQATPKRRRDARKRGQILKSNEVNIAVTVAAVFGGLKVFAGSIAEKCQALFIKFTNPDFFTPTAFEISALQKTFTSAVLDIFTVIAPILGIALISGLVVNYMQVGFLSSGEVIAPKLSRINPLEGFKRMFSFNSVIELVKSLAKLIIIGSIMYSEFKNNFLYIPGLLTLSIPSAAGFIFNLIMKIAFNVSIALIIIAAADYIYQWFRFEKELKMTKQEVKDEFKMTEGDPKIKAQIRQMQRQISQRRMMADVATADVVITNPTHFAVALKYDEKESNAPLVVAKGQDYLAQKIKEKARENGVELVENRSVARALYFTTEIGEQIPPNLFGAVAEILAYVYKLHNKVANA